MGGYFCKYLLQNKFFQKYTLTFLKKKTYTPNSLAFSTKKSHCSTIFGDYDYILTKYTFFGKRDYVVCRL